MMTTTDRKARFVEINYQGTLRGTDYMWGVHAAGCSDVEKECMRRFGRRSFSQVSGLLTQHEASSMRELLDLVVDGETRELGWGDENVKIHNCVKLALRVGAKA